MRYWSLLLMVSAVGAAASRPSNAEAAARWEREGGYLFLAGGFKQAARAFEKALAQQPDNPALCYRLGRSYARLAEVSSPLFAPKNARKARRSLEQALRLDPQNSEYLRELFEFYLDSPEWFGGGMDRAAALLERIGQGAFGREAREQQLADSRKEHSGVDWWLRCAFLRTSGVIGYFVPQP